MLSKIHFWGALKSGIISLPPLFMHPVKSLDLRFSVIGGKTACYVGVELFFCWGWLFSWTDCSGRILLWDCFEEISIIKNTFPHQEVLQQI